MICQRCHIQGFHGYRVVIESHLAFHVYDRVVCVSDITSHVLMVMMGYFSMETHGTPELLVMGLAVSTHSGDGTN